MDALGGSLGRGRWRAPAVRAGALSRDFLKQNQSCHKHLPANRRIANCLQGGLPCRLEGPLQQLPVALFDGLAVFPAIALDIPEAVAGEQARDRALEARGAFSRPLRTSSAILPLGKAGSLSSSENRHKSMRCSQCSTVAQQPCLVAPALVKFFPSSAQPSRLAMLKRRPASSTKEAGWLFFRRAKPAMSGESLAYRGLRRCPRRC